MEPGLIGRQILRVAYEIASFFIHTSVAGAVGLSPSKYAAQPHRAACGGGLGGGGGGGDGNGSIGGGGGGDGGTGGDGGK